MRSIPLRAKYPDLYTQLTEKLEKVGLHAFDVKADILIDEGDSETFSIKYGDQFTEKSQLPMDQMDLKENLNAFLNETIEKCQKQAVEDYYTFMDIKPVKIK